MSWPNEISAEQEARLRARLQVQLDAGEWYRAEQLLQAWLQQFGHQLWMLEQLGHLQLRRAAWRDAGQSFFWAGIRGPQFDRALEAYLGSSEGGRKSLPSRLPRWARGPIELYPEVVQRELAEMGAKRKALVPRAEVGRDFTAVILALCAFFATALFLWLKDLLWS
jgi:hypothetical protein